MSLIEVRLTEGAVRDWLRRPSARRTRTSDAMVSLRSGRTQIGNSVHCRSGHHSIQIFSMMSSAIPRRRSQATGSLSGSRLHSNWRDGSAPTLSRRVNTHSRDVSALREMSQCLGRPRHLGRISEGIEDDEEEF